MAVAEVLVHVRITLLTLWLGVFPFISGWPQKGHSQYHSHPEVVIPLRITGTGKGMKTPGWLSYSLHFGGQRHIIHMKVKKLLVSRHFPVFTYTDQGALQEDQPYVQSDCYYHGYVEGEPESIVALSSCFGGFQGMLQISDIVYEMKPKRFSATHEHLIYRLHYNETELPSMKCGLTEEQIAQQLVFHKTNNVPLKQSNYEGWWTHRWFIEFAVVVDHQRFLHRDNNASWVLLEVLLVLNEINAFYSAMDVDLGLSGLEIWNQGNLLQENDMEKFLISFCQWKRMAINNRIQHDILHLFIKQNFGIYLGLAYIGTICHQDYNCGVDKFEVDELFPFAHVVAHEIGHNLGMVHDDHACTCGKSTCIMFPAENDSRTFSNCSYASLYEISSRTFCMRNLPYLLKKERQCGNGVVEEGEACDCGSLQMCTKDPCCLTNCTLRPGAVCGFGLCCKDCQFRASGELCREKENECDLPEWCNGIWHECPEDVYKQNGYKCLDIGFCYKKTCNVRDEQCRQIFGKKAKNANQKCYRAVNTLGDRFGNCGNDSGSYIGCNIADILCGRIQCENVTIIPYLKEHTTVHSSHISGHECWGTDYHFGMPIPDIGDVKDGTECGEKRMCVHKRCVPVTRATHLCSEKKCHKHGVCNNKDHCHCNSNWAPPSCAKEGNGGSVDSGPPPHRRLTKRRVWNYLRLIFWFPFWLFCCCLLILLWTKRKTSMEEEKKMDAPPVRRQDVEAPPERGQDVEAPPERGQDVEALPEEGQDDATAPEEEQDDAAAPEGEQGVEALPEGEQGVATPPEGEQGVATPPEGEQGVATPPEGEQGVATPPEGEQGVATPPEGEQGVATPPEGEQGVATPPEGEQGVATPPEGEQGVATPPEGEQGVEALPEGEQSVEALPEGEQGVATPPEGEQGVVASPEEE